MRVAFVSFEYSGIGSGGGIGTYTRQASRMMALRGHEVEVFCAAAKDEVILESSGVRVNALVCDRDSFAEAVRPIFASRHQLQPFDLIEGPEFGADARLVHLDAPQIALIVRLHTPTRLINEINDSFVPLMAKARFIGGALRRGQLRTYPRQANLSDDIELQHVLSADIITAPSASIAEIGARDWGLPPQRVRVFPNIFEPTDDLLKIPLDPRATKVLFLGKLEVRKGVIDLAKAVALVNKAAHGTEFLFVGRDMPFPGKARSVQQEMRRLYQGAEKQVRYQDAVSHDQIPSLLKGAAIAVFPSIWENFPYVCLEAMAAGRAVIGSNAGGMSEIIEHSSNGYLVPPRSPKELADAIIRLVEDNALRMQLGASARATARSMFTEHQIGPLQEAAYQEAIANAAGRGGK